MIARTLAGFSHTWLTCAGLLIFLIIFLCELAWVYRRGGKQHYETLALYPLGEEANEKEQANG